MSHDADPIVDRIMDSAMSRLPGAVSNAVYLELARVLDLFFTNSTVWRESISVDINATDLTYELFSSEVNARIVTLESLKDAGGGAYPATLDGQNTITIPRVMTAGTYTAKVFLTVGRIVNDELYPRFPQWVSDKYGNVIADGVVGRMAGFPAKPFSAPAHAVYYTREFNKGIQMARIDATRGNLYSAQAWSFPRFAAQR